MGVTIPGELYSFPPSGTRGKWRDRVHGLEPSKRCAFPARAALGKLVRVGAEWFIAIGSGQTFAGWNP